MRFEKLNDNKIRIIITNNDLKEKNIDFHSFMSNPIESQSLFFDMLNEAEKEIGFTTRNYNIKLEAMQINDGDFVITVTRSNPDVVSESDIKTKRKISVKRKNLNINTTDIIYCFKTFDDFCGFADVITNNGIDSKLVAKNISLYEYKDEFYLVLTNINLKYIELKKLLSIITEFATHVNNSDLFKRNLVENGKIIMKNNAIITAVNYFSK